MWLSLKCVKIMKAPGWGAFCRNLWVESGVSGPISLITAGLSHYAFPCIPLCSTKRMTMPGHARIRVLRQASWKETSWPRYDHVLRQRNNTHMPYRDPSTRTSMPKDKLLPHAPVQRLPQAVRHTYPCPFPSHSCRCNSTWPNRISLVLSCLSVFDIR